jgi:hypothetical protein
LESSAADARDDVATEGARDDESGRTGTGAAGDGGGGANHGVFESIRG